jgi:hypothetical protein
MPSPEVEELLRKYKHKIEAELGNAPEPQPIESREYQQFKDELMPNSMSLYERTCNLSEHLIKIKPDEKRARNLQEAINICHLNVTPTGTASFAILFPLLFIVFGSLVSYLAFQSYFFVAFFVVVGMVLMVPLAKLPEYLASAWRMKASNQMVICIFYVVTYMRHTSNLEKAIEFASEHLAPPLSLDLRKVLWDVEAGRHESVRESLESYLETWRQWNLEFIESFHLIESSLFEGLEERRLSLLDKSLDVILDETYEKMLHYAQNLKNPVTMLHMMGIILPILGLVILPLIFSFMETVKWYHIAMLYNVLLPIAVYYMGKTILSSRPTGYGDTDISEENPELKKYRNILIHLFGAEIQVQPIFVSVFIGAVLFFLGISPILLHAIMPDFDIQLTKDYEVLWQSSNTTETTFEFLGYKKSNVDPQKIVGPYGIGASVLSLCVPLSFGLGFGLYYKLRSHNVIKIREQSKKLEDEFASALFQLGNRLGDNLPAEIAFGKVADLMEGTISGSFFRVVSTNISKMGMGVNDAIFDPHVGALVYYPSKVIASSMKVLSQSIRKGPHIAAQALLNISRYIKEIHKVNERLKDLMSEIISSMKSQISFLTPVISGIVIGITSMITNIISKLGAQMRGIGSEAGTQAASMGQFFGDGLPTYYFQIVVGLYVVQIIFVLTVLSNGIENGEDKLNERYLLGTNLIRSTILYSFVSLFVMVLFNFIASSIMTSTIQP